MVWLAVPMSSCCYIGSQETLNTSTEPKGQPFFTCNFFLSVNLTFKTYILLQFSNLRRGTSFIHICIASYKHLSFDKYHNDISAHLTELHYCIYEIYIRFHWFSTQTLILSANNYNFVTFFLICILLKKFPIAWVRISKTMFNNRRDNKHPCFYTDFIRNTFLFHHDLFSLLHMVYIMSDCDMPLFRIIHQLPI